MSSTLKLASLGLSLMALILVPFVLFGSYIETYLTEALTETPSTEVVAIIVFLALAADVVLPLPSSLLSAAGAVWLGPVLGVAVIWAGMTTGHLIGYALGRRYGAIAVKRIAGNTPQARLESLGNGVGMTATIVITRAVPVLSEACTVMAGAAAMPLQRFGFACASANLGVALVYGFLGAFAGGAAPFLLIFVTSIAVPLLGYGVMRIATARSI